ncbi:DUF4232 domain-containing protein [Streptomyces sp. NBC_00237]|uniref:DUF4232 domain-containing protein n=1 Tax=Streptomyces sp. NBC_00237 TaxID=2975687 RepID=UPI002250F78D|nr:DUF4232 domain-containing protein [Streptomyces sp. NBC_00237]MCX5200156.1 DUF4232 domain-containing protein [Streptomyces sp. NBC_00237]
MSVAVVAVAVLGVGGCSGGDDGAPAGQAVGPASATEGPGTVEGLDDCVTDGVAFRVEVPESPRGDRAGFRVAKVVATGTGTRPCLLDRAPYVHVRIAPSGASITVNRPEPRSSRVVLKPGGEAAAPLYYTVVVPKGGRAGAGCGPAADGTATVALAEGPVSHSAPIGRPGGRGPARLVLCPDQAEVGGFRALPGH